MMNAAVKATDVYGLALFGIWTVLLAAVWIFILYDRRRSRNTTHRPLRAPTNEQEGVLL